MLQLKSEKNPCLETLLHLKKYRFLIFVGLDLVVLENCTRMQNLDIKSRGIRDYEEWTKYGLIFVCAMQIYWLYPLSV